MDSLVTKKATFCDTGFGKLNLITNAQGKLISMNCETKMDKTGFKELVKAVRQKYGKPALKKAETGKDELKKILINSMVSKGKNIPVYLWKLDDEYIGLFMEGEDIVKLFRAKKEFEDLLIKVNGPYIEATIELQKWERKMFKRYETGYNKLILNHMKMAKMWDTGTPRESKFKHILQHIPVKNTPSIKY